MTGFLAIGTGRCGTKAFARFAYELGGRVIHEKGRRIFNDDWRNVDSCVEQLAEFLRGGERFDGVVGYPFLPCVFPLRELFPELRVICLHRDKEGFMGSARRAWPPPYSTVGVPVELKAFVGDKTAGYSWYWEMYEEEMAKIPGAIHVDVHKEDNPLTLERVREVLS